MSINDVVQKLKSDTGLLKRVAAECGITPTAVRLWEKVPIERVPSVERVTGIPRHKIRPDLPDLFPVPQKETAKATPLGQ